MTPLKDKLFPELASSAHLNSRFWTAYICTGVVRLHHKRRYGQGCTCSIECGIGVVFPVRTAMIGQMPLVSLSA